MASILIREFGPIKSGYTQNNGWMKFSRVTAFCGPQGSGKSCAVKVFSFFSWLEKVLMRGDHRESVWLRNNKFPREFAEFHNVKEYFRPKTILRYQGDAYQFDWEDGLFTMRRMNAGDQSSYSIPKIMYVPAERNFMSVLDAVDQVKSIPPNLKAVTREFLAACEVFADGIDYPVSGFSFKYDKLNHIGKIKLSDGSEVRLSAASSGLQSMTPLFLVSEYLYRLLNEDKDASKDMSLASYKRMFELFFKDASLEELPDVLQQGLSKYSATLIKRFINVVEEPEQNLYPSSQQKLLYKLLEYAKGNEKYFENQLVLTTHSPYIIEYLRLVARAAESPALLDDVVMRKTGLKTSILIPWEDMSLYETQRDGSIIESAVSGDGSAFANPLKTNLDSIVQMQDEMFPVG